MRDIRLKILLVILVLHAIAGAVHAEPPIPFKDNPEIPWELTAERISFDHENMEIRAEGNVMVTKADKSVSADVIIVNRRENKLSASGNLIFSTAEDRIEGSRLEIDLTAATGAIYDADLFHKPRNWHVGGARIEKTGESSYEAEKGSFTTCDGENPDWRITGDDMQVTIEGYGTLKHAVFWIRDVPVLYVPYIVLPAKVKRQSGFLPPRLGYSKRKWEEYTQPWFWAISDSSDATFHLTHMGRRGQKAGMEYRYVLSEDSRGVLMFDWLRDKRVDDGSPGSSPELDGYAGDSWQRPDRERYWLRVKANQELPLNFSGKLDMDFVSDQDYLTEFKSGFAGFEDSSERFEKTFGRDLEDYTQTTRTNRLNLSRIWSDYSLEINAVWYDNIINRLHEDTDTSLYKIPSMEFTGSKQKLFNSAFYFDLESGVSYSWRREADKILRADARPALYLPYRLNNFLNIEPSAGFRQTFWKVDAYQGGDANLHRELYDLKLDVSSKIFRIFDVDMKGVDKIKHTMVPQVVYEYMPDMDKDEYPDHIAGKNLITWSLINRFTTRSRTGTDEETGAPLYSYNRFGRLKLSQSYDLARERDRLPEPFLPVKAEMQLDAGSFLSFRGDAEWSQYDGKFVSRNMAASMADKRGDRLLMEHRYKRGESESLYWNLTLKLTDFITARMEHERNLHTEKDMLYEVGVGYTSQCWAADVSYVDENDDKRYEFTLNLLGLGEVGQDVSSKR